MSDFKGILHNWGKDMERPLVGFNTLIPQPGFVALGMQVGDLYYPLRLSKVNPPKDVPRRFRVVDVYRFPMCEDMRLTVVRESDSKTVELQFVFNEAFIQAAMPKPVETPKPVYKYRVIDGRLTRGQMTQHRHYGESVQTERDGLFIHFPEYWHDTPSAAIDDYRRDRAMEMARITNAITNDINRLHKQAEAFQ